MLLCNVFRHIGPLPPDTAFISSRRREIDGYICMYHDQALIPLKTLAILCKSLATMQHSGVSLLKTLEIASRKTGDAKCRRTIEAVREEVRQGTDIAEALRLQQGYFPELMIDMVSVGEQSGALPEVLDGLASHYENITRLRRMLIGRELFAATT